VTGLEQAQDALNLVPSTVQEWQYLLPVEVGPRLVERYVGGEVGLYLQCRLESVAGAEGEAVLSRNTEYLEVLWELDREPAARCSPDAVVEAPRKLKRNSRKNRVECAMSVHVSQLVEHPKRLRSRELFCACTAAHRQESFDASG
jgi:hypothetical protein